MDTAYQGNRDNIEIVTAEGSESPEDQAFYIPMYREPEEKQWRASHICALEEDARTVVKGLPERIEEIKIVRLTVRQ